MTVRTRFAPSPTGYLHLGGARTALFARAWAQRHGGEFLLRVEDTDAARSQDAHSDAIIRAMEWLNLHYDGEAQYQSRQRERHVELAQQLATSGAAYKDEGALRLKTPATGETFFDDLVCGRLAVENKELEDPVILRGDQTPTYIFASAADDMDSRITHVIRGDDHVRNTHKQLHLYEAFGISPPQFAHLPMILSADGARLSKRHAAVDILQYERDGFLPSAMVNYLARLSWSHGDMEIFSPEILNEHFDFNTVSRSPARFDMDKLRWVNSMHLRGMTRDEVRTAAACGLLSDAAVDLILPRAETMADVKMHAAYFTSRPDTSSEMLSSHITPEVREVMNELRARLSELPEWTAASIKSCMKDVMRRAGLKFPQVGMPMRVLLTGRDQSPDIAEVAAVLGKEEALARLG